VTNAGLTYIYQGGTYDAEYLIAFFYPVSTDELPDSAGEVSSEEMQQVDSNPTAYLEEKATQLNNLNPEDWQPDLTVLDAVISSLQFEKSAPPGEASSTPVITGQLWSWIGLVEPNNDQPAIVPYPDLYMLIFYPEGRFDILADCNSGSGSFQMEGESLTMTVEMMTMAFCSPDSLSDQFINLVGQVESFTLDGNQLHLGTKERETMLFSSSGPVVGLSEVPAEVPTAVALEPLNIRSGPGSGYPSYGTAPIGATGEVIGVSEDGGWWVVKIPVEVDPDQHGWVNANYVQVTGAEDVPVIPAP
jgi:heat shock protein HslJ